MSERLVEWVGEDGGCGITSLAIAYGLAATGPNRVHVLLDQPGQLHAPALVDLGLDPERLLVLRPRDDTEAMWAAEQAMRCPAVGVTLWPVDRLRSHQGRRAKLAVERGGGVGLLVRPWRARREACWADVRYLVKPLPTPIDSWGRGWRIEIAYRRGGVPGETFEATLCDETGRLHMVTELADPATERRAS